MNKDELWERTLTALLEGVPSSDLKSVFLNLLTPMGIFGNSFVLIAQNSQVEEWVNTHYLKEIEETVAQVYGSPLVIGIGSNDDEAPAAEAPSSNQQDGALPISSQPVSPETDTPETEPDWMNTYVNPADIVGRESTAPQPAPQQQAVASANDANKALFTKCSFDTFVVGPSNEFARGAALAVAEQPGVAYNPLFIYGNSGLGKTHLLVAIANYVSQNFPNMVTLYVSANDFLNDFVAATQKNQWAAFNQKYHQIDVLLIDDVQYLENKDETINQLFNIFNEMTRRNKQVVLSADRAPRDINMDERMRSRFNSGLLADIKPPDYETRLAILKNYMARVVTQTNFYGLIPDDVLAYLAEVSTSNIREIEGSITRLISNMSLLKRDTITVEETRELLKDFFPDVESKQVDIATIMSEVERYFGITHEDMVSAKRQKGITNPRHIAIYLSRYLTEESLEAIGKKFGGRDHTTIMHSVHKIETEQKSNRLLYDQIEQLTLKIKESS